ncbi:MAG: transcriptional repressor LexA [Candidatus Borkfalkiaceae bacterium]|nr:transcriptional repressor LexA [Clostridia bacterium]MDY6223995.1 transcriptional repressor LexA [Christensenellaceae bacterium]
MDESKLIKVMDYIRRFSEENGYMPSVREIGANCSIKSTATVHSYLERLQEKGYLNKVENKKRAVTLSKSGTVNIPLLGTVTAGQPVFAYENYEEYYTFPVGEFRGDDLFMLHVRGTSMIKAGICDGDKIVVRRQSNADDGDIVVALVGETATVKRLYRKNGKVILHPENDLLNDFVFEPHEVSLLGKVVGLIRNNIS